MAETTAPVRASIEVAFSDRPAQVVPVGVLPFLIGRGRDSGNHLPLDDMRISRKCVAISADPAGFVIEDRGQLNGIFVNGEPVKSKPLADGDRIRLGTDNACQLVFRLQPEEESAQDTAEIRFRSLLGSWSGGSGDELKSLRMLLEATQLLQSQLPLESVLSTMLDHAIAITHADRGMLLEPDAAGALQVKVARGRSGENLPTERMNPSRSVLGRALELETAVINEDLNLADLNVQTAQSVMLQLLRSAVVIPLYGVAHAVTQDTAQVPRHLLGAVYLDSKRTATFSALDRQILDALGSQAASILDNARLMERERERQRLEQELSIAREIQQALVPQGLQDYPHLAVTGIHRPCHEVGGDYFDVFPMPDGRTAILIADVAGKGLGAALLTTMLQGALSGMTLGVDPVSVINHLNRFLCERASIGRYATMFFGLIGSDGVLEYVPASHPSPLLLRRGAVSDLYTGGSFPVGLLEMATYQADRIQLEPDDTLLLYSDGVTEAEDKIQNMFGRDRLKAALAPHQSSSLGDLQAGILRAVERFAEGASQSDDITILVVRYRRPDPTPPPERPGHDPRGVTTA